MPELDTQTGPEPGDDAGRAGERSPGGPLPALPAQPDLPAIEHELLARWRRDRTFEASVKADRGRRPGGRSTRGRRPRTGCPGVHHIEARVFKDLFPRFKTMQGFHVARKAGWDCHGLPVEVAVEKELGLSGKPDIEAYGVAEFNQRCRESVLRHVDAFAALTTRMGYWIDLSTAYRTMDASYVESVWWALKTIYDQGLLVRDFRISPYCPRCGTPLSDHEMGQPDVYREVTDPSVTVRFPIASLPDGADPRLLGADLLVWTTTPWTLVSNTAIAVHPDVEYVIARRSGGRGAAAGSPGSPGNKRDGDKVVVAAALWPRVLGRGLARGHHAAGQRIARDAVHAPVLLIPIANAHRVVSGGFVTTDDGTGLVHLAPAFGADDLAAIRAHGMPVVNPVRADGHFTEGLPLVGGLFFKDANEPIIADLAERGLLLRSQPHAAQLPALLAVRHHAAVLRAAVLVRPHHRGQGPAARGEREDQLAAAHDQARPVRRVAAQQRRLGPVADPVLGHAAAGLGVRRRARDHRRVAGRAVGAGRAGPVRARPAPAVRGRRHVRLPVLRAGGHAGARGDRRLVRLRVDAVRPVGRAAAELGRVRVGLPGPVHLRGDRPDAGLVLLADGGGHPGLRPVAVRERGLPRAGHGRAGPEDVQAPGQRHRADGPDGRARRRRGALVSSPRPGRRGGSGGSVPACWPRSSARCC